MEISVKNIKTHYEQVGTGPDILLLHGWGSSCAVYKGIMGLLSDNYRLTALDFPGCGQSETLPCVWDVDDYAEFVLEFIEKTGLQNPILIGHSHGGRVSLKLAGDKLLAPPKIILLDAAGLIPKKSIKRKLRDAGFKIVKGALKLPVVNKFSEGVLEKARNKYGSADYKNAATEQLRNTLVKLVNTDLRDILPNIKCPTLLIWGENDTATPLDDAKIIEKLIPDAGLCVIKHAGHFAFCEQPRQAHAIIKSFLG